MASREVKEMSCTNKKSRVPNNPIALGTLVFLMYILPIVILTIISGIASIPHWLWNSIKEWGWDKTE